MFTTLTRVIAYGLLGFRRNGWLSTTTISILVVALIVFGGLIIFRALTNVIVEELQDQADFNISFKIDTPEDDILAAKKAIESIAEVKKVEYISRDRALEIFRETHKDDPEIQTSLEMLKEGDMANPNPLPASLKIKVYEIKDYPAVVNYLDGAPFKASFKDVKEEKVALVMEKLRVIIDVVQRSVLTIILFLTAVAVLVTFNTIRLAIYSSRDEIGIMRLVGASNFLIRGPYMVEGVIYGIIAAIISLLLITPAVYFSSPYIKGSITEMDLWKYFISNSFFLFLYQLAFGIALGVVSSFIAVRKYLRI